jgi:A/G-specific adenine glycosylase
MFMQRVIQTLSRWYNLESRDLPWRQTTDAYCIWISEIILQQTRVVQGVGYYNRFVMELPNIQSLANAEEGEVLKLWQGLGYYSRARNLHYAAKQVMTEFGGVFPSTYKDILRLRGVGNYTAAAIASFAFGEKVPAIDGNVKRVGARFFGLHAPIHTMGFQKELFSMLFELMDGADPNAFNQAMIEVGATLCLPTQPKCDVCPLGEACIARLQNLQKQIPVVAKKQKPKDKYFYYVDIEVGGERVLVRREGEGIWQQLYEFPMIEGDGADWDLETVAKGLGIVENFVVKGEQSFKHQLTHQTIYARCWYLCISSDKFVLNDGWERFNEEEFLLKPIHRLMEKMIKFT